MDQFALLAGLLVGVVLELVKRAAKFGTLATYAVLLGISLLAGAVYVLLRDTPFWATLLQIVIASQAVYALLLRQLPKPGEGGGTS